MAAIKVSEEKFTKWLKLLKTWYKNLKKIVKYALKFG